MENLLEVKGLSSKSRGNYVYEDINFSIGYGEVVGLLGHNGAGKSTMLRNIANYEIPQEGEVYVDGNKLSINKYNKDVVLIPDVIELEKSLSIKDNILLITNNHDYDEEFLNKYLEKLKLKKNIIVGSLSKGNQEILQLVILLSLKAKIVLFDEPFSAIDIFRRELICELVLDAVKDKTKSIIITTHLISEIEEVLSRFLYLDNTNIIMDKKIEELDKNLVEFLKDYFKEELR